MCEGTRVFILSVNAGESSLPVLLLSPRHLGFPGKAGLNTGLTSHP